MRNGNAVEEFMWASGQVDTNMIRHETSVSHGSLGLKRERSREAVAS